jgi:hypothetical protein
MNVSIMNMRAVRATAILLQALVWVGILAIAPAKLLAVPVTFQYQGHILVDGEAYQGVGFFKFSLLKNVGANGEATVWRNDAPNGGGGEPASSIRLTLTRGVYSVSLGDTALPNMALIEPSIFDQDALSLRVWFSQDNVRFDPLSPDTKIGSVAFAVRAATVDSVQETALPPSVTQLINLADKMTFSSKSSSDADLIPAGFRVFRELEAAPWENGPDGAPAVRTDHAGVWTGREFVIWGGATSGSRLLSSGAKFDTLTGEWETVSTIDSPVARRRHGAVWTGDRMFVWGGHDGIGWNPVGGQYDPRIQKWFPIPRSPILAREDHVMVWTGEVVVIWGGRHAVGLRGDGAIFSPNQNQWSSIPEPGAPLARSGATGVWSGNQLVIWGGRLGQGDAGDGARLSIPQGAPMSWQPISRNGAPSPRQGHSAVWTGGRMIVWGGVSGTTLLDDGASYDPITDQWSGISRIDAPSARSGHNAVWTAKEMLVLFGTDQDGETASAHAYDPVKDTWRALPSEGGPVARIGATVAWTGRELIAFGGEANGNPIGALQSIDPESPVYLYRKP